MAKYIKHGIIYNSYCCIFLYLFQRVCDRMDKMNSITKQLKIEIYRIEQILKGLEYCDKLSARSGVFRSAFESLAWDAELLSQIKKDWERIIENR